MFCRSCQLRYLAFVYLCVPNSATSITGCIAIGIAVDDTIHFLMAFRQKLEARSAVCLTPSSSDLEEVGRPMLVTTVVLTFGFSVLLYVKLFTRHQPGNAGRHCDACLLAMLILGSSVCLRQRFRSWRMISQEQPGTRV